MQGIDAFYDPPSYLSPASNLKPVTTVSTLIPTPNPVSVNDPSAQDHNAGITSQEPAAPGSTPIPTTATPTSIYTTTASKQPSVPLGDPPAENTPSNPTTSHDNQAPNSSPANHPTSNPPSDPNDIPDDHTTFSTSTAPDHIPAGNHPSNTPEDPAAFSTSPAHDPSAADHPISIISSKTSPIILTPSASQYVIGSIMLFLSAPVVTVPGTTYGLASGNVVIDGTTHAISTATSPDFPPITSSTEPSISYYVIDSITLSLNGPAVTISGTTYSLGGGGSIVIDGTHHAINPVSITPPTKPLPSQYIIGSITLSPSGPAATVSGTTYSLASGGSVVIDGTTHAISSATSSTGFGGIIISLGGFGGETLPTEVTSSQSVFNSTIYTASGVRSWVPVGVREAMAVGTVMMILL